MIEDPGESLDTAIEMEKKNNLDLQEYIKLGFNIRSAIATANDTLGMCDDSCEILQCGRWHPIHFCTPLPPNEFL